MNRKTTLKLAVLTACQDSKKSIRLVLQNSKAAKFCLQNHINIHVLTSSENDQSFYSIAIFFVRFTTLSKRNPPLHEEKSNVSSRCIGVKTIRLKIGDPKSRNGGTAEWWKITPNPKRRNGEKSP